MNQVEKQLEFVSFCIEQYKAVKGLPGEVVADLFNQAGLIDFLLINYDILHTQSKQYLMEEIELFLKEVNQ